MKPTLRRGSTGPAVEELQRLLTEDNVSPGPVDGVFGPSTEAAVRVFQKRRRLTMDGVVGPATWAALTSAQPLQQPLQHARVVAPDLPAELTWGLDVSAFQDWDLPWHELYDRGARFAYVRVCVGSTVDRWAARHAEGARAAGFLVGGYGVPSSNAADRLPRISGRDGGHCAIEASRIGAVDLPLACDLELPDVAHLARASAAAVLSVLAAAADWCDGAEAVWQRRCALYSGPAWLATALQRGGEQGRAALVRLAGVGAERPLWLAQYPLRDVQAGEWPAAPAPWSDPPAIWQVSGDVGAEALLVDGRRVDLDVTRLGVDELRALVR